jgi:hemolysin D
MKLFKIDKEKDYRTEFLPAALEIIEKPESPLGKRIIWGILAIIMLCILWAIIGQIDEVATASGKLIPDGNIKVIQSMEGGVITAIHVQEGQHVEMGQLLIELDTTINAAELDKLKIALDTARVERALLQAAWERNSSKIDTLLQENSSLGIDPEVLLRQKELSTLKQQKQSQMQNSLRTTVAQSTEELTMAQKTLGQIETKIRTLEDEVRIQKMLADAGAVAAQDLIKKQNELELMQQQRDFQLSQIDFYQAQIDGKQTDVALSTVDYQKTVMEELVAKDKAIQELEKEVEKTAKRLSLQSVIAPVDGIVQGVSANTIGGLVSSETPIVTIVPDNTPLVLEAMVLNKDIGFVHTGQQVDIKLDTFPFQKYGAIPGEIVNISPDAIEDEKQGYVYKIKVKPQATTLKVGNKDMPISPGMTAQAEVKTGTRRIIEFFLPGVEEVKDGFELR